jgi:hypothetical protein
MFSMTTLTKAYLIQVSINHPRGIVDLFQVEGAENERQARRAAYEAVYGEPINDEERATDETIEEYTAVRNIKRIKIGGDA